MHTTYEHINNLLASKRYIRIPAPLTDQLRRMNLPNRAFSLYTLLYELAHFTPDCSTRITLKKAASKLNAEISTARRAFKSLEDAGLIEREQIWGGCITRLKFPEYLVISMEAAPDRRDINTVAGCNTSEPSLAIPAAYAHSKGESVAGCNNLNRDSENSPGVSVNGVADSVAGCNTSELSPALPADNTHTRVESVAGCNNLNRDGEDLPEASVNGAADSVAGCNTSEPSPALPADNAHTRGEFVAGCNSSFRGDNQACAITASPDPSPKYGISSPSLAGDAHPNPSGKIVASGLMSAHLMDQSVAGCNTSEPSPARRDDNAHSRVKPVAGCNRLTSDGEDLSGSSSNHSTDTVAGCNTQDSHLNPDLVACPDVEHYANTIDEGAKVSPAIRLKSRYTTLLSVDKRSGFHSRYRENNSRNRPSFTETRAAQTSSNQTPYSFVRPTTTDPSSRSEDSPCFLPNESTSNEDNSQTAKQVELRWNLLQAATDKHTSFSNNVWPKRYKKDLEDTSGKKDWSPKDIWQAVRAAKQQYTADEIQQRLSKQIKAMDSKEFLPRVRAGTRVRHDASAAVQHSCVQNLNFYTSADTTTTEKHVALTEKDVERMILHKGNNTRRTIEVLIPEVMFSLTQGAQKGTNTKKALRAAGNMIASGKWRTPYGFYDSAFSKCA